MPYKIKYKNKTTGKGGESKTLRTMRIGNLRAPWWTYERHERPYMLKVEAMGFLKACNSGFRNAVHDLVEV